jgi:hypothetical protein
MISELQMKQALEVVLRDVSKAILQALPEQAKEALSCSQLSIESGSYELDGKLLLTVSDAAAKLSLKRSALSR